MTNYPHDFACYGKCPLQAEYVQANADSAAFADLTDWVRSLVGWQAFSQMYLLQITAENSLLTATVFASHDSLNRSYPFYVAQNQTLNWQIEHLSLLAWLNQTYFLENQRVWQQLLLYPNIHSLLAELLVVKEKSANLTRGQALSLVLEELSLQQSSELFADGAADYLRHYQQADQTSTLVLPLIEPVFTQSVFLLEVLRLEKIFTHRPAFMVLIPKFKENSSRLLFSHESWPRLQHLNQTVTLTAPSPEKINRVESLLTLLERWPLCSKG